MMPPRKLATNKLSQALVLNSHPTVWKPVECIQAGWVRDCDILLQDESVSDPKRERKKMYMWNFKSDSAVCLRAGHLSVEFSSQAITSR